jgi:hypothetical protein
MLPASEQTVITLSNMVALSTAIVSEVTGGPVAETINGSFIGRAAMDDLVASTMNQILSPLLAHIAPAQ